jgi:hypothetical protein
MIDNPFTYGNPISEPKHFFGRTREVRHVVSQLRGHAFGSSSLVGESRDGVSFRKAYSLLVEVTARLLLQWLGILLWGVTILFLVLKMAQ